MASFLQYMGAGLLSGAGEGMEKEANLRLKQEAEKAQQLRAEHLATFRNNLEIDRQGKQNKYLSGQQEKKNKFTDAQTDKNNASAENIARIRAKSKKVKTGLKEMPGYVKDMFKHQKVDPKTGEPVLNIDGKPIYEQDLEGQNKLTSFMMENGITDWNKGYALLKQIQSKAKKKTQDLTVDDWVSQYANAEANGDGPQYLQAIPLNQRLAVIAAIQANKRRKEEQTQRTGLLNTRAKASENKFMQARVKQLQKDMNRPGLTPAMKQAAQAEIDNLKRNLKIGATEWSKSTPTPNMKWE